MSSVNKVILVGNLGNAPDCRTMQSGDKVVNLSIATSESWKSKETGERKTKTEWHKVVIFNQGIAKVAEMYLKKGSKVYIEGQLETRSWEQDGVKKYATEIVLRPYRGELTMLDGKSDSANDEYNQDAHNQAKSNGYQPDNDMDDDIPF
jgi:single-strand DNA-binding protein